MGYFPLCIDLSGKCVLCVGTGTQIQEKIEKLRPFGAQIEVLETLTKAQLDNYLPELVIAGDMGKNEEEKISLLCREQNIPVNVVDVPELCTFFFPSLISKGDLTISVSTGGKSPAAAACVRRKIEQNLPDRTEEILLWLGENRSFLREKGVLKEAVEKAFSLNRTLTKEECELL